MKLWAPTVFKARLRDYSEYKNEFHTGPAWMRVQPWERVTFMPMNHPHRRERKTRKSVPFSPHEHMALVCVFAQMISKNTLAEFHTMKNKWFEHRSWGKREASGIRNWRQNDGLTLLAVWIFGWVLNLSFFLCKMGIFTNLPGRVVLRIKGVITNKIFRKRLNSTQQSLIYFPLVVGDHISSLVIDNGEKSNINQNGTF